MSTTHTGTSISGFPVKARLLSLCWEAPKVVAVILVGAEKTRERWDVDLGSMKVDSRKRLSFLLVPTPELRDNPAVTRALEDTPVTVSKTSYSKGKFWSNQSMTYFPTPHLLSSPPTLLFQQWGSTPTSILDRGMVPTLYMIDSFSYIPSIYSSVYSPSTLTVDVLTYLRDKFESEAAATQGNRVTLDSWRCRDTKLHV